MCTTEGRLKARKLSTETLNRILEQALEWKLETLQMVQKKDLCDHNSTLNSIDEAICKMVNNIWNIQKAFEMPRSAKAQDLEDKLNKTAVVILYLPEVEVIENEDDGQITAEDLSRAFDQMFGKENL